MSYFLSVVTSAKDYFEIVNKLIESDTTTVQNYSELGSIITYLILSLKSFVTYFLSFSWLSFFWKLPVLIPDINSAMISEVSVLDGYLHNAFTFLEVPTDITRIEQTNLLSCIEKLIIGLLNSLFLFLPTNTTHIITLRRFVMQGLSAGYIAGLGTIAGNIFWLTSVILGWRCIVIPWLSLDIWRYGIGFILLIKYMWDSYNERRMVLEDLPQRKIFLFHFVLTLTEQSSIYPFISNITFNAQGSILETFTSDNYIQFMSNHLSYIFGIGLGSFALLQLSCWFWENPAFQLYMWLISRFKVSTNLYYRIFNFLFLYLIMISAITSIPYYGLDYTITNPLGLVNEDRIVQDSSELSKNNFIETSFLNTKASDRNTRRNRGRHGRRERWKRRIRKYRAFDAGLYENGIYDLLTLEDLNYGFDRFWLRRKLKNHRVRFRFFPGPWMRSFKKQLSKPRLESYTGPRIEFFRILFEQIYHPAFHAKKPIPVVPTVSDMFSPYLINNADQTLNLQPSTMKSEQTSEPISQTNLLTNVLTTPQYISIKLPQNSNKFYSKYAFSQLVSADRYKLREEKSFMRKFIRKFESRLQQNILENDILSNERNQSQGTGLIHLTSKPTNDMNIYSKRWKHLFSRMYHKPLFVQTLETNNQKISTNNIESSSLYPEFNPQNESFNNFNNKNPKLTDIQNPLLYKNETTTFLPHRKWVSQSLDMSKLTRFDTIKQQQFPEATSYNRDIKIYNLPQNSSNFERFTNYSSNSLKRLISRLQRISRKDLQIMRYKSLFVSSTNKSYEFKNPRILNQKTDYPPQAFGILHPLKFYLQGDLNFQRKLKYYTPNIFRKFSIENNAPYFRVMLKRYFYSYKPTKRWIRTMKNASMRQSRRKTTRIPRQLKTLSEPSESSAIVLKQNLANSTPFEVSNERIEKPTFNYSVVSKQASRYRYQIYKDVMQHWYYTPFNRFFAQLDVDNFIRRQPKTHFMTANEENLLHLRRFFLSEHYNSLRWYTQMEHYRTFKTEIGKSKSFSSRIYNQQFAGTFKKIRHLFAITPSATDKKSLTLDPLIEMSGLDLTSNIESIKHTTCVQTEGFRFNTPQVLNPTIVKSDDSRMEAQQQKNKINVLKFDQPLYNETNNTSVSPILSQNFIHEELLPSSTNELVLNTPNTLIDNSFRSNFNKDLIAQSQEKVKLYLTYSRFNRENNIKSLLNEKKYIGLTQFVSNGQKLRGPLPTTNQIALYKQERRYLSPTLNEYGQNPQLQLSDYGLNFKPTLNMEISLENMHVAFLKNWKRRVDNQQSLQNYLSRRVDERNERSKTRKQNLNNKLNLLNKWLSNDYLNYQKNFSVDSSRLSELKNSEKSAFFTRPKYLTSGLQKAINNGQKTLTNQINSVFFLSPISMSTKLTLDELSLSQKSHINDKLAISLQTLIQVNKKYNKKSFFSVPKTKINLKNKTLKGVNNIKKIYGGLSNIYIAKILFLIKPIKNKNLEYWRQKQRVVSKRKRLRKELKFVNSNTNVNNPLSLKNLANINLSSQSQYQRNQYDINASSTPNIESGLLRRMRNELMLKSAVSDTNTKTNTNTNTNKPDDDINKETQNVFKKPGNQVLPTSLKKKIPLLHFQKRNYISKMRALGFMLKRQRSPQLRYRVNRDRGVFNKRHFGELFETSAEQLLSQNNDLNRQNFYYKWKQFFGNLNNTYQKNSTSFFEEHTDFNDSNSFTKTPFDSSQNLELTNINNSLFTPSRIKQMSNKQENLRSWQETHSDLSFVQKRRKYLKRRRYTLSQIRVLSQQLKRSQNKLEIQKWWWKHYLPTLQNSINKIVQEQKESQITKKFNQLSLTDNMKNNKRFEHLKSVKEYNGLQIGNKDFKPLALPETSGLLVQDSTNGNNELGTFEKINSDSPRYSNVRSRQTESFSNINDIYQKIFLQDPVSSVNFNQNLQNNIKYQMSPNTCIPFYAGWDESQRQFVVTNRLLSRQDAGYKTHLDYLSPLVSNSRNEAAIYQDNYQYDNETTIEFEKAPLQGMNAATTLYWQVPFTTYDPDQFFALGMDGFSPIAWRKMLFRHSALKSWLENRFVSSQPNFEKSPRSQDPENSLTAHELQISSTSHDIIPKSQIGLLSHEFLKTPSHTLNKTNSYLLDAFQQLQKDKKPSPFENNPEYSFNISRRLKKRLTRVKKHPTTPVWFPSGPLLNQVLPVHYIYVFYTRSRLPGNRYLGRRLLNSQTIQNMRLNHQQLLYPGYLNYDFTLRKRFQPMRKYHLIHDSSLVIPRRLRFITPSFVNLNPSLFRSKTQKQNTYLLTGRLRPFSPKKLNKSFLELLNEQKMIRSKRQQRLSLTRNSLQPEQPSMRVKQLKRRVQRQVITPIWRQRPRSGGFVWPGDYLKLEQIKVPRLRSNRFKESFVEDKNKFEFFKNQKVLNPSDFESQMILKPNINTENRDIPVNRRTKQRKKTLLTEWQIQPKKYLLDKHNLKVLKKKRN